MYAYAYTRVGYLTMAIRDLLRRLVVQNFKKNRSPYIEVTQTEYIYVDHFLITVTDGWDFCSILYVSEMHTLLRSRDVREWLATFPFPPIPISSFPFPIPFP